MIESLPKSGTEFNAGNLTLIYKEHMDVEEWLDTRSDGIGGSDIGVIMGVNPWTSPTRLWYEKLGLSEPKDLSRNDSVFWGRAYEDIIRERSQYWDRTDPDGYMTNYEMGNKVYSHIDFPFFAINKDFPWLRMNVDGLGYYDNSVSFSQVRDEIFKGNLIAPDKLIEIKTIKERTKDRWEGGIPYGYVYQVLGYLTVFLHINPDLYGEIYSQISGTKLQMNEIEFDSDIVDEMLVETYEFWNTIEAAKEVLAADLSEEETLAELYQLEPAPDGSKDYADFLSEKELAKIAREKNKLAGNDEMMEWALRYNEATINKTIAEGERQKYGNLIKDAMRKNNASIIEFGDEGRVTFNKRLYVNLR